MKLSLLSLALLALAPAAGAKKTITSPWSIQTAPAAAPDDILGEHQPLERSWTVASSGCGLDTLYLALPGRVFVELDPSALPPPPPAPTEPPVVETEPPVVETEPPVVETEPPVPTETEPPVPTETEQPLPILPPVVPIEGSGSGSLASGSAGDAVEFPTVQLRRHREEDEDDEEEECPRSRKKSKKDKKHKKHEEEEEPSSTVYIRVVVTGDSPELLDMIEVVPLHPRRSDAIKLHLANADAQADGYLLTTVYVLNPRSLRSITTAFDGEVVVDDRVLAIVDDRDDLVASDDEDDEDDNAYSRLSLAVVGDANLYVDRPESSLLVGNVSLGSLNVVVTGSGTVQLPFLLGASVSLGKSLDIDVAGSGAVALAAQSVALDSLSASVTGSGVVVVETTGAVTVDSTMELSVFGSGGLSVSTSGTVDKEKLELSGAGQLLAGSIAAKTADVSVWGSGLVLVQAIEKLTVSTSVWGAVGYVNAKPATVKIDGWWFWRSADEIVYPAAENLVLAPEFSTAPPKYPTYYAVETHFSKRDDDPDYTIVTTDPEDEDDSSSSGIVSMAVAAVSTKAEKATGLGATTIAALAIVAVAVVAVAARSFEQFRMRRQYTRLL